MITKMISKNVWDYIVEMLVEVAVKHIYAITGHGLKPVN